MSDTSKQDSHALKVPIVSYGQVADVASSHDEVDSTLSGGILAWVGIRKEVTAADLNGNLNRFLKAMQAVLDGVPAEMGGYKINAMDIEVEVSAEGGVSLLGTGGKMGGKGSVTLKLTRSSD
jgi:hypothetical protein